MPHKFLQGGKNFRSRSSVEKKKKITKTSKRGRGTNSRRRALPRGGKGGKLSARKIPKDEGIPLLWGAERPAHRDRIPAKKGEAVTGRRGRRYDHVQMFG